MPMPSKFELMLPLLKLVAERDISMKDAAARLAQDFNLTPAERAETLSTGKGRFYDRASWARVYLRQAGLLDLPRRGQLRITGQGRALLKTHPSRIDMRVLEKFPAFQEFLKRSEKSGRYADRKLGVVSVPGSEEPHSARKGDPESTIHTEVQYRLLKLGSALGLSVWVARNDRGRSFGAAKITQIPNLLAELPTQFDRATNRTIELIDVLWLDGRSIVAAFEIEATTSIYSGLLRMSDLTAMQPNINIRLFLVAPEERRAKVMQEINRPTFSRFSPPLNETCRFLSFEALEKAVVDAAAFLSHLRPDFVYDRAESCIISDEER